MFVDLVLLLVLGIIIIINFFFRAAQYFWKLLSPCVFIALFFPKLPTHEIHISHFFTVSMPCV